MSSQPVWVTPAGSLGTIAEGAFFESVLDATTADLSPIFYTVVAGALPSGIECTVNGIIQGVPTNIVTVAQETIASGADITSKFAIRAYTVRVVNGIRVTNRLSDRTFTITVAGQNAPMWITPPGLIEEYFDGSLVEPGYQLQYTNDNTTGIPPAVTLIAGSLPPGLTLSSTGLISGYVGLNPVITTPAGFSRAGQGFSSYPFDFTSQTQNYTYEFTLRLTDGRTSTVQTFNILVWTTAAFDASTTLITADNTYLTASISNINYPVLINPVGSIGTVPNNTFFAYQFIGEDVAEVQLAYHGINLPPGLTLNSETGWLYGYIPNLYLTQITYDFNVYVYQYSNPSISSPVYDYSLTVTGPISAGIYWNSPSNLGSIFNGDTSLFSVVATSASGLPLQYFLVSGSNSRLPQGLSLHSTGNIVGRVSFDTFSLDNNLTTFDVSSGNPTTFDLTYTFTVNASSINGYASASKTFTITVIRKYNLPYNNLYITCMPPADNRQLIASLLQNATIFPPSLLYRQDDPNFGLSSEVVYYHAYGLNATSLDEYVLALQLNHYWKNLQLGSIETARALDPVTGEVIYEVVYSKIIDTLVNNQGTSVGKEVRVPYPINPDTQYQINEVYPNSLANMRDQVIDVVGQESNMLPLWMLSKQTDGNVLGFTPAWVIAYTKPNASGQIAYNISTRFGDQLNQVDYTADRYELDNALTNNWNASDVTTLSITNITVNGYEVTITYGVQPTIPFVVGEQVIVNNVYPASFNGDFIVVACSTTQVIINSINIDVWVRGGIVSSTGHWMPTPPQSTTFDINYHYIVSDEYPSYGGSGYTVGTVLKIAGNVIGGISPVNDCFITVNTVDDTGGIISAFYYGTANILSSGKTYNNVNATVVSGTGSGALWNITIIPGVATIFDGGSVTFNDPANMDTNTNAYDKYLMFPNRNIIDSPLQTTATWTNEYSSRVTWVNNSGQPVNWLNNLA